MQEESLCSLHHSEDGGKISSQRLMNPKQFNRKGDFQGEESVSNQELNEDVKISASIEKKGSMEGQQSNQYQLSKFHSKQQNNQVNDDNNNNGDLQSQIIVSERDRMMQQSDTIPDQGSPKRSNYNKLNADQSTQRNYPALANYLQKITGENGATNPTPRQRKSARLQTLLVSNNNHYSQNNYLGTSPINQRKSSQLSMNNINASFISQTNNLLDRSMMSVVSTQKIEKIIRKSAIRNIQYKFVAQLFKFSLMKPRQKLKQKFIDQFNDLSFSTLQNCDQKFNKQALFKRQKTVAQVNKEKKKVQQII